LAYEPHIPEITSVIQLAVAPVFMLTAVGTIISALSIRLGRAVDRRRDLEQALPHMPAEEKPSALQELEVIARRIRFVYFSIVSAVVSGLFISLLIAGAFLASFLRTDISYTIGAMFALAVLALTVSLLLFLREIFLAVSTPRHIPR
jgi:H+/Cl- antiporter ClcA